MLVIRKEQMSVFRRSVFDAFVARMLAHLREAHLERTAAMSDAELETFVRAAVRRAKSFRVRSAVNLEIFLDFVMMHGLDCFDALEFDWARQVLESNLGQNEKASRLSEYMIFGSSPAKS
jgi:hypothetical protein